MKQNCLAFLVMIIITAAISCTKHRGDYEEFIPKASLVFYTPTAGAIFHTGDSVNITALAISTQVMHGYDLSIRKTGDTTSYFFVHAHDHNDTLSIDKKWKIPFTSPTALEAEIILYLDHDGHTKTGKIGFKLQ